MRTPEEIRTEFIQRATKTHNNRYDYTYVKFERNFKENVLIRCPEHGLFPQRAQNHLKGTGCPKCAGCATKTTNEFIREAISVHGNRYDYSNSIYRGAARLITIKCHIHGKFTQRAMSHLSGHGCPECNKHQPLTTETFITKAIALHGDRYDYSQVIYHRSNRKVIIGCNIHGLFEQTPNSHLMGSGCPKCGRVSLKTTSEFIADAIRVHGERYDYSAVDYTGADKKVIIICPRHGKFPQRANSHLAGHGCPICAREVRG